MNLLTLRIGGEGGEGVISSGEILTKAAARSGYHIYTYRTYPAEIRGGLCMFQLRVDDEPVPSAGDRLDMLVAFNQDALDGYLGDMRKGGVVLYDPEMCPDLSKLPKKRAYELPLNAICKKATDSIRGKNVTAVGAIAYLLGIPLDKVVATVKQQFKKKGDKVVGQNILAIVAGYQYGSEKLGLDRLRPVINPEDESRKNNRMILSGNQAVSLGALAAGVRFCAGYPITPATPIFEFLARELPKFGGYLMQVEDEISAINACIGASYGGSKVLTPTSGPGMALMSESINLASMAEIPILIVDVQRSGPSTGMPTKTEQGDLNFALYGTPGDAPRVVIAPATVEECFHMTVQAVNIAERYQVPVILLSDASLAYRTESVPSFDMSKVEVVSRQQWIKDQDVSYQRYALTENGISPIAVPGTAYGEYQATGLEHDEFGHPNYSPQYHEAMHRKRYHKLEMIEEDMGEKAYYKSRPIGSKLGIISWGSTKGTVREAIRKAEENGIKVAHFHPHILCPLPVKAMKRFISYMRKVIVVEENFTGQLAGLIRSELHVDPISLTKCQGVPFSPEEIYNAILGVVKK
jgi:2-oxoglutarate ferredoxin oxidoreductase subunit alpha